MADAASTRIPAGVSVRFNGGGPQLAFQRTEGVRPSTWPDAAVPQMLHLDTAVATRDDLQIHPG
jgi:hypothetical protein